MSENKRKTPTGNHASSLKSISRGSRIFDSFKRLFSTVKELSDETSTLEDYSMFMDNHRKLNANLEEKDKTIMTLTIAVEDMKKAKAVMWEEFTTKHKEYQGQIDILKDAVDAKQQLESQILDTRKMQRAELAVCNSVIDSKLNSLLDSLQQEQLEEFDTDTMFVFPIQTDVMVQCLRSQL
ncbi:hypothetical protein B0T17DRAFT_510238 [Bombardia bombarda]|uniref:Uncharacterized protein n=1 Tax=Bombardia bombarda TaxID=252184 RepID=A0AA39WHT2_9PEZI|nr:hypothetical protein B0T17DRAFT_510238 [Bombardia bombarda]